MAKVKAKVSVKPSAGVSVLSISIDGDDVPLVAKKGTVSLESPDRYIVIWQFSGAPGETLGIEVEAAGKTVFEIKKSRIPANEFAAAGIGRFDI